jgi:hypothetical protein
MCRHDGHRVSQATVLRLLRDEGLLLAANYQRERRQLAARRKAVFATGPARSTPGSPTRSSPTFPNPKTCEVLDAGHVR